VVIGFEFAIGAVRRIGFVMKAAVGQRAAKAFVEEQEQEEDTSTAPIVAMLGWFSEASTLASRSKRASRSRMLRKGGGQSLDRYFTIQLRVFGPIHFAMPPLPSGPTIPQLLEL
jgi:hypothetical protein